METSTADQPRGSSGRARRDRTKQPPERPAYVTLLALVFVMIVAVAFRLGRPGAQGTCSFDSTNFRAACKGKGLTAIPPDIPDSAQVLQMGDSADPGENHLTELRRENFTRFKNLRELSLVRCDVENIAEEPFADLPDLRVLDLRFNRIRSVSESSFRGLSVLDQLLLSNNPIQVLDDYVFRGLRIAHLEFANNPVLGRISPRTFQDATIARLVFNRCNIKTVKQDTLSALAAGIRQLRISDNLQPLDVKEEAFKGFRLERLVLTNDGITSTAFLKHGEYEEIALDRNPLETIKFWSADKKKQSQKVTRSLSLSGAKINRISRESFSQLGSLELLNLSSNGLQALAAEAFEPLPRLTVLDLADNDIVEFDGDFSRVLPQLKVLLLNGNALETLPAALEPFFSRLENLTLDGNPFHCNCEIKWFFRWLERSPAQLDRRSPLQVLACKTPAARNFSQISEYDLKCRPPSILNATIDSDGMTLVCTADGDPAPTVTWLGPYGEESTTGPASKARRVARQTEARMTMVRDGNYTCTAVNVVGGDRVVVDTDTIPVDGVRFFSGGDAQEGERLSVLETPRGFLVAAALVGLLGYIMRQQ